MNQKEFMLIVVAVVAAISMGFSIKIGSEQPSTEITDSRVVQLSTGKGLVLSEGLVLTAEHVAIKSGYPILKSDREKDLAVISCNLGSKQPSLRTAESTEDFVSVGGLSPSLGDSGKPYFENDVLVGIVVGFDEEGNTIISTVDDTWLGR